MQIWWTNIQTFFQEIESFYSNKERRWWSKSFKCFIIGENNVMFESYVILIKCLLDFSNYRFSFDSPRSGTYFWYPSGVFSLLSKRAITHSSLLFIVNLQHYLWIGLMELEQVLQPLCWSGQVAGEFCKIQNRLIL